MRRALIVVLAVAVLAGAAYLVLWPVLIEPVAWDPPPAPAMVGALAPNDLLAQGRHLLAGVGSAPEDVAFDAAGRLYTGFDDGRILRVALPAGAPELVADTAGRPLGMVFDAAGNLVVADGRRGLLSVSPGGEVTVLATGADGRPFGFLDDLDIGPDGTIFLSDASTKFGYGHDVLDLIEHGGHGRLLAYDPRDGSLRTLLGGLQFANGVVADPEGAFVLVAESGAYRITRYWLAGPRAGSAEVFVDNLPGFPDNISRTADGRIWVPLPSPRMALLDRLGPRPFLRTVIARLPESVKPGPIRYGLVVELAPDGRVLRSLHDPSGAVAFRTSAMEREGSLYLGTYLQSSVVVVPVGT
jgi:sugar lactone lactonase YvrE